MGKGYEIDWGDHLGAGYWVDPYGKFIDLGDWLHLDILKYEPGHFKGLIDKRNHWKDEEEKLKRKGWAEVRLTSKGEAIVRICKKTRKTTVNRLSNIAVGLLKRGSRPDTWAHVTMSDKDKFFDFSMRVGDMLMEDFSNILVCGKSTACNPFRESMGIARREAMFRRIYKEILFRRIYSIAEKIPHL